MNTSTHQLEGTIPQGRFTWIRQQWHGNSLSWIKYNTATPLATDGFDLQSERDVLALMTTSHALRPRIGFYLDRPALILDDLGGATLCTLVKAGSLGVASTLHMALDLSASLKELHRHKLVHHGLSARVVLRPSESDHFALFDCADAGPCTEAVSASPNAIDTLKYAAPERTGRLGQPIDERADLYSLGALMYQALTGQLPFVSEDPLELIHAHIARTPTQPSCIDRHIPAVLSDIVMKLLSKAPEARYQTVDGLMADLARCLRSWQAGESISPFVLASMDGELDLRAPALLYGRSEHVLALTTVFEAICDQAQAHAKLVMVWGPAGVGKTSVIQSLQPLVVARGGHFISGKFDQVIRGQPFLAWVQAFRALTLKLLAQGEEKALGWQHALHHELGSHAAVVTELVPEMALLTGETPPPPALGPTETINRFRAAFCQLVAVLAKPAHPLLIFLDDLQWADEASLDLLQTLLRSHAPAALMLVASCRATPPPHDTPLDVFCRTQLDAPSGSVQHMHLSTLAIQDLRQMLADLLHQSPEAVADLAGVIHGKTGGNPFVVKELLRSLRHDGILSFDTGSATWVYDLQEIRRAPMTDNVVDLIARRVRDLPAATQALLVQASMLGESFSTEQLSAISGLTTGHCTQRIEAALYTGLLAVAAQESAAPVRFRFAHDRIQQAAYALTDIADRSAAHLWMGRKLLEHELNPSPGLAQTDALSHLNLGRELLNDASEKLDLARRNLQAGFQAKSSAAHGHALTHFKIAAELIEGVGWDIDQALCFQVQIELAQALCLCGRFQEADPVFVQLREKASDAFEAATVLGVMSVQRERLSDFSNALSLGRQALALLGEPLAEDETNKSTDLVKELTAIAQALQGNEVASLIDLPLMHNRVVRLRMSILTNMWSSAYITGDAVLSRLISARMVRLSIEHGNSEESAYGYVTHAVTMGPFLGDFSGAFALGQLALAVNAKFNDVQRRAKILQQFQAHVNLWLRPFQSCVSMAQEAYLAGLAQGDHLYAAYAAGSKLWSAMQCTDNLLHFVSEHEKVVATLEQLESKGFSDSVRVLFNWARSLIGPDAPGVLSTLCVDDADYEYRHLDNPFFMGIHLITRQAAAALLGQHELAHEYSLRAQARLPHLIGTVWPVLHAFWQAMTELTRLPPPGSAEREQTLQKIDVVCQDFEVLSRHCASNFLVQNLLLRAQLANVRGDGDRARAHLAEACDFAERSNNPQLQGLALACLGQLELEQGHRSHARAFLKEAQACFSRWGSQAKVQQIQHAYMDLWADADPLTWRYRSDMDATVPPASAGRAEDSLDLFSMVKASQAIAVEVEWDRLLDRLMHIIIESAGARRGTLILERNGSPFHYGVEAPDGPTGNSRAGMQTGSSMSELPLSIIHHVSRTHETVVLHDAQLDDRFTYDPLVSQHAMRSVLCTPVLNQARLIGVLFLENSMVSRAFNEERVRVVSVLSAQAAISLENAELVSGLRMEIEQRTQTQGQLKSALEEVQRLQHDLEAENTYLRRDLIANLSHDLRTPLASIRGYLEVLINKADTLTPATRLNYKGIALRQTNYLADLTEQLLELAKLDFKGVELQCEPLKLSELAFDATQKFILAAQCRQVELCPDFVTNDPFVQADARLIERVLDNLIGNALQHTPPGGRVTVKVALTPGGVQIEVRDTGKGIEAAQIPFIFNRFFRGEAGRGQNAVGAGLGLAITKRILELHGSTIRVQSQAGCGSSFSFRLN